MRHTGWRTPAVVLVCGGVILMLALGTRQSFGLFLHPMPFAGAPERPGPDLVSF